MEKRFCETCGNLLGNDDLFCEKCGSKVNYVEDFYSNDNEKKEKRYCMSCGNLLNEDDIFCHMCGAEVLEEEVIDNAVIDNKEDKKIASEESKENNDDYDEDNEKEEIKNHLFCISCGAPLNYDDRFCQKCGTEVLEEDEVIDNKNDKKITSKESKEDKVDKKKRNKNVDDDKDKNKKICLSCGETLNDDDRFCQKCGTEVVDYYDEKSPYIDEKEDKLDYKDSEKEKNINPLFCISCGAPLDDGDRFCQKCGAEVLEEDEDKVIANAVIDDKMISSKKSKEEKDEEDDKKEETINPLYCISCGAPLNNGDRFCQKCGAEVLEEEVIDNVVIDDKDEKITLEESKTVKDDEEDIKEKKKKSKENHDEDKENNNKSKNINICHECGAFLNDNDIFCYECGAKVAIINTSLSKDVLDEGKNKDNKDKKDKNKVIKENVVKEVEIEKPLNEEEKIIESVVTNKKTEKKSKVTTFAFILMVILLIVFCVLLYLVLQDKEKGNSSSKKDNNDTEEKDDKDKPSDKDDKDDEDHDTTLEELELEKFNNGELIDFYQYSGKYTTSKPRPNSSPVGKVSLENSDYEIFDSFYRYDSNWKVIGAVSLYRDGGKIKIYDSSLNQGLVLGLSSEYEEYKLVIIPGTSSNTVNNIFGVEARKGVKYEEDQYGMEQLSSIDSTLFYDIRKDKKIFESNNYFDFRYINLNVIQAYQKFDDDKETILLDLITEEELMSVETNDLYQCGGMTFNGYGDNYITLGEIECVGGPGRVDLYTTDLKLVLKNVSLITLSLDGYYLFFNDNNVAHKYDDKGNEVNKYKFDKLLDIIGHYFIVVENGNVVVKDEEDLNVVLGPWKDNYSYHSLISGYYDANQLSNENEKEAGIYLIIQTDENGPSSGVEYYFNIDTHKTKKFDLPQIGGYAKPVLYLYPEKDTDIEVSFENKDNLTTTYPKYKDSWKVFAKTNGDLYDEDGKYYYGLYWEEELNHEVDFSSGFYVEKDNAIEFLEEKLTLLGFNDRERNEFIMYWLPILEKNGKSLVYFELTQERDSYNKLNISPAPDSLLRVAIHVKKVDKKVDIKEQTLPIFERVGFTAVEWGGVVYN